MSTAEHPDPLVRDQYVMTIASRCQIDPDLIRSMLASPGGAPRRPRMEPPARVRGDADRDSREMEALRLAIHRPDDILALLIPDLFTDPMCSTVYDLLCKFPSLHEVIDRGGPEVGSFVQRLSVEESTADPVDVAALLWIAFIANLESEYRLQAHEADAESSAQLMQHATWLRLQLEDLQDPDQKASTVESLLGWMLEESEEDS